MRKRIIWFCNTEHVAEHPESLAWLRDEMGLTTIMPESPICHTSGFAATPEVAARGPFEDWRSRADRWPKADDGIYPPVAGVIGGFDDAPLRRVLEAAERAGIEVWGHIGLWSYGGDVYPEWAMRDIDGSELDPRYGRWGIGLCPSKEAVNAWVEEGLLDVINRYGLGGFCVDHARYPQPANVHALAACGCADCRAAAEANGFDVDALIGAVRDARGVLEELDEARVKRAEASGGSGEVILDALGHGRRRADAVVSLPGRAAGWAHGALSRRRAGGPAGAGLWQRYLSAVGCALGRSRRAALGGGDGLYHGRDVGRRRGGLGDGRGLCGLFVGARAACAQPRTRRGAPVPGRAAVFRARRRALARQRRCVGRERGHRDLLSPRARPTEAAE